VELVGPNFSLALAAWIPCALTGDPDTGEFRGVEGPDGFTTWDEADEASRFLVGSLTGQRR
jgi:hypothetical protein